MDKNWLLNRARERSTWFGITAFLTSVGVGISGEVNEVIISLGVALSGLVAVVTKD